MKGIFSIHFLLLPLIVASVTCNNGLWVAVENRLESLHDTTSVSVPNVKHIIGITKTINSDSGTPTVFATGLDSKGPSVYKVDRKSQLLLARDQETTPYYEDIAYDTKESILYLTSSSSHSILILDTKKSGDIKVMLESRKNNPSGITIDSCSRRIYWTNSNRRNPSIETFHPSAPRKSISLVTTNLTRPRAITVDQEDRRLYYSDTRRGRFKIESCLLDGSDRRIFVEGDRKEPFSIAVDKEYVYWSDWITHSVWRIKKNHDFRSTSSPELVRSFPNSKPHGISVISPSSDFCISADLEINLDKEEDLLSNNTSGNRTEIGITDGNRTENAEIYGKCNNYCLGNGICNIDIIQEDPVCECLDGRTGLRCEQDPCHNFCLDDVVCIVIEDEPECLCNDGFEGDRCQINITQGFMGDRKVLEGNKIPIFVLIAISGLLIIIVSVLSVIVFRMRKRPRIVRKRFISVNRSDKNGMSGEGLSSQCGLPVEDGITFDIENCCNMTLCDTPCFEPPTRGPNKQKKKIGGCQDKRSLLEDQEDTNDDIDF